MPSEPLKHRSPKSQMSDETSSSSSEASEDEDSTEEESSAGETAEAQQSASASGNNYLHHPWLLENREDGTVDQNSMNRRVSADSYAPGNTSLNSHDCSSSSNESSSESSSSSGEDSAPKKSAHSKAKARELPEWERNPQLYYVRRSSRQKKEP
uniref:Uncharacterized protein n=1 Tax=Ciona savignyi TaxID=51511 RepID=H2Z5N1_CIOSA